jgi:hypothetical protein
MIKKEINFKYVKLAKKSFIHVAIIYIAPHNVTKIQKKMYLDVFIQYVINVNNFLSPNVYSLIFVATNVLKSREVEIVLIK